MTIDANGAAHARDGRYTAKDNTAAPDGLLEPTRTQAAKDALTQVLADAKTAEYSARLNVIEAVILDLIPDAAAVSFIRGMDWPGRIRMDLAVDRDGEIVWDFNDGADLTSLDWQAVGYIEGHTAALEDLDGLDTAIPSDTDSPLADALRTHRWYPRPRILTIGATR